MPNLSQMPVIDKAAFRNGMAKLPSSVNIVTSVHNGVHYGFTASSVCSVTDTPATLLTCVNRDTQSYSAIVSSGVLCVNVVASEHADLSAKFAGAGGVKDMSLRFADSAWTTLVTGSPVLAGASAAFDCRIASSTSIGTHDVFYCEVLAVETQDMHDALVYFNRKFHPIRQLCDQ